MITINSDLYEFRSGRVGDQWLWPKSDDECWRHLNKKRYSNHPKEISKHCKDKNLIIQAGGNAGVYPKQFSKIFKSVITIEPDLENFFCLNYNVTEENVFKFQACLGAENKPLHISRRISDGAGSYMVDSQPGIIPQLTIDSFGVAPDMIQLDIEGYEGFALLGGKTTINNYKPVLVLETNSNATSMNGWGKDKIEELIFSWGYKIVEELRLDTVYKHKDLL